AAKAKAQRSSPRKPAAKAKAKAKSTSKAAPKAAAKTAKPVSDGGAQKPTAAKRGRALVIVESPAKAKTIKKYLGPGYTVKASVGHIKDLPKSKMSVDRDDGFRPHYEIIRGKSKV